MEGLESDINFLKDPRYKVDSYVLFNAPWNLSCGRSQNFNLTSEKVLEQAYIVVSSFTKVGGIWLDLWRTIDQSKYQVAILPGYHPET